MGCLYLIKSRQKQGIRSIQLPKNLKTIEEGAFAHTRIKKIHLPEGLTSIGQTAFLNSPLEKINIPASLRDEVSGLVRVKWDNSKKGNGFWKRFTVSKNNPYYKIKCTVVSKKKQANMD